MRKLGILSVSLMLFVILCGGNTGSAQSFYRCQNRTLLDTNGAPFIVRGTAVSFWLNPEAYALRLNDVHGRHLNNPSSIRVRIREILGNDTDAQAFWDAYEANMFTQSDFADLAAEGFNTIRVPFNYRLISPESTPGVIDPAGLQQLDTIVSWCKNAGLAVLLDMHSCPGGQSHDAPADPEQTYWYWDDDAQNWMEAGVAALWEFNQDYFNRTGRTPEFNKQRTVDIWQAIAAHFADEPAILGYELINEPFLPYGVHYPDLRDLLIRITTAIRAVDTNHIVFVSGNQFAGSVDGLVPPWDANMAISFHRYWCPTTYASIAPFVDASVLYNLPICLSETGENSNDWFFNMKQLLESQQIGWCWWGIKKVRNITAALSSDLSSDYQYVIDNFRDSPIDPVRAKSGLMQMAAGLATSVCDVEPGHFDALLSPLYGTTGIAFLNHVIPGKINAVDYNIGAVGVAYSDTVTRNEAGYPGAVAWNEGFQYRNDGVDIATTAEGNGYKVAWTANGESLKFTAAVASSKYYKLTLRTATPNSGGKLRLYRNGSPITAEISIPNSGGYEIWRSTTVRNVYLPAGTQTIEVRIVTGGFDLASIDLR